MVFGDRPSLQDSRKVVSKLMSIGKQSWLVPGVGLEPTRITPADFKSAASASSATPASGNYFTVYARQVSNRIIIIHS